MGSCPHILNKSINRLYNGIIIEPKEAVGFGNSEFLLVHLDLVLSNKSGKETRYIQYTAGETDKIPDNYCTNIV